MAAVHGGWDDERGIAENWEEVRGVAEGQNKVQTIMEEWEDEHDLPFSE